MNWMNPDFERKKAKNLKKEEYLKIQMKQMRLKKSKLLEASKLELIWKLMMKFNKLDKLFEDFHLTKLEIQ